MEKLKGNLYKPDETPENYADDSYEQLDPGAYICKISLVKDESAVDKRFLYIEYDIVEGDHAGYFERLSERAGFWGGRVYLSYKDKAQRIFSRAIKAINKANPGYVFDPFEDGKNSDEKTLVGKTFAIVLHEEEYTKNDGSTGTRITGSATSIIDVDKARSGEFNKKLLDKVIRTNTPAANTSSTPDFMDAPDNPFA